MSERKRSKATTSATWIIVGLLMFGMIGFGAVGLSGTARSIGTVGDKAVPVTLYYNALNSEINNAERQINRRLSASEIQAFGIENQALARVVQQRAMDQQVSDLGIGMGDARLAAALQEQDQLKGLNGQFDRVSYDRFLERFNLSSTEYETSLAEQNTRAILQEAVLSGLTAPEPFQDLIVGFLQESRDFSWARISSSEFETGVPVPTAEELAAFHTENAALFTIPRAKDITYVWLTPDMLAGDVEVSEEDLRQTYEDRSAEFNIPEIRVLDRLVFADQAAAQAALTSTLTGGTTFDALVAERGLTFADVSLGDVRKDRADASLAAAFETDAPGLVGPVQTNLGPALIRVNAILDAQSRSFEDLRITLTQEAKAIAAAKAVDASVENIEDLLAGGATLEDVAAETDLQLGQINWYRGVVSDIAAYSEFQTAAVSVTEDDFASLINLADGGVFAIRMNKVVPSALQPLEDVKASVTAAWEARALSQEARKTADVMVGMLENGTNMASLGLTEQAESDIVRTDFIEGTPPSMILTVFEMQPGEIRVVEDAAGVILVQLKSVKEDDLMSEESQSLRNVMGIRLQQAFQTDVLQAFGTAVQNDMDVAIDDRIVQSLNSQVRGQGR